MRVHVEDSLVFELTEGGYNLHWPVNTINIYDLVINILL